MTLAELMIADVSVVLNTDEHAETASYTPHGSSAGNIIVIVDRDSQDMPQQQSDGQVEDRMISFFCSTDEVPTVVPLKDHVTLRNATFTVISSPEMNAGMRRVDAQIVDVTRKSRQDYERPR